VLATCDHLVWGGPDLESAVAALAERTGVRAAPGGQHPELGTHNAIARLGRKRYLEVIAPDPELRQGALARQLVALESPTLLMWAARTADAKATAARAEAEGFRVVLFEGRRTRADGRLVRWTNVFVEGHGAGALVPFFIEWHDGAHPSDEAPDGLHLHGLHAETPEAATLRAVLEALDVRLPVRKASHARLVAVLDTPRGRVELP
jgi:hypothetical protein